MRSMEGTGYVPWPTKGILALSGSPFKEQRGASGGGGVRRGCELHGGTAAHGRKLRGSKTLPQGEVLHDA